MDFDDMLEELGEMGKFQITTYLLVCLAVFFGAANSFSYVFAAGIPNYRCFISECDRTIEANYQQDWLPMAIPPKIQGTVGDEYVPSQCHRYKSHWMVDNYTDNYCTAKTFTKEIIRCDKWVFDDERTIVNDWNITCLENQWMLSLIGTVHFAGIVIGTAVFGILADRYGRKLMFVISIMLMAVSGAAQVISPEYITFSALIFLNAVGTAGVYPLAFIIGVELVGRKKRETTGIVLSYFYSVGEASIALFAWLSKDWIYLQLVVSAPCILFFVYYWWIPESIRWLLIKQKSKEAKYIVCKAAKMNGVTLSSSLMSTFDDDEMESLKEISEEETDILPVVKLMMRSRKLLIRFAIILFIWIVNAFVYNGLSLNSTSMGGNKYINFALVCLIEIPGYTLAWISMKYCGRKPALVGSLFLCGFTCIGAVFVSQESMWAMIALSLIGKLGITSAFGVLYVHTAELLPTIVRSGGMGASSTFARCGALLSPFVPLLGVYVQSLPMILFGGVSMVAALLALKLPETLGLKLPESVEEAKRI